MSIKIKSVGKPLMDLPDRAQSPLVTLRLSLLVSAGHENLGVLVRSTRTGCQCYFGQKTVTKGVKFCSLLW